MVAHFNYPYLPFTTNTRGGGTHFFFIILWVPRRTQSMWQTLCACVCVFNNGLFFYFFFYTQTVLLSCNLRVLYSHVSSFNYSWTNIFITSSEATSATNNINANGLNYVYMYFIYSTQHSLIVCGSTTISCHGFGYMYMNYKITCTAILNAAISVSPHAIRLQHKLHLPIYTGELTNKHELCVQVHL